VTKVEIIKKAHGVVRRTRVARWWISATAWAAWIPQQDDSLGGDIVSFVSQVLKPSSPGLGDNFDAFVIHNDAANFSVGANIMMLLMAVQEGEWDEVDLAI